ncbi:MAG TPA: glycosyltransferase family 4 protein [Longimicrobiales bacterium]
MKKQATILYVDNSSTFGGAINALSDLLRGIDRSRVSPVVLSAQSEDFLTSAFPGIRSIHWPVRLMWVHDPINRVVERLPGMGSGPLRAIWGKLRALWWLTFQDGVQALRIMRLIQREHVDAVHLNNGVEGMIGPLAAARLRRLPVIAHARGPQSVTGMARTYASLPDHWIAVSRSIADNLEEAGVPPRCITVVHDAIDLTVFFEKPSAAGTRTALGIPENAKLFGVFARIIPWKGIREFVLAARQVLDSVEDAFALVVGDPSDGSEGYYREVVELSRSLGIENRIVFAGFRTDVADLMRACDVVVHSSIEPEPFGLTVIEGMATGRPVVAASSGGPVEIIEDGVTGVLVDPSDATALSAAVTRLLENPAYAEEIGSRAAQRARAYYSTERYASDVMKVYEKVFSAGARTPLGSHVPDPVASR